MKQLLHESIIFANKAHKGQLRKGTDIDYISHPMEVMQILTAMQADDNLIIAGVLHDTVEDTGTTVEEIEEKFGDDVAALVAHHSEDKRLSWIERKTQVIDDLQRADKRTKMLVLADKVSNMRSMYANYLEVGEKLWDRFNAPKEKQCWYYSKVHDALWDISEFEDIAPIYDEMTELFKEIFVTYRADKEAGVLFQLSATETHILTKGIPTWELSDEEPSVFTEEISREEAESLEEEWSQVFWDCCDADLNDFECTLIDEDTNYASVTISDAKMTFEGHDVGLGCNIITGGDEYRYYVSLDYEDTYDFICHLRAKGGIERSLNELMVENFGGTEAFTKFMDFCKKEDIKYVFYSL